uniref:Uncharacterized protein n=1 Tax=Meloidogyne enterolobii TaxID=390850 RepID=A0A6V7XS08_MELEN|nr:unnamed protein product [Meloidogyne enterolobii]
MKLLCVTTRVVYDLMEHSDYYSTLYYNRRVCQDDKYLLNIEDNDYNIPSIAIECEEAIYENHIENLYLITIQNLAEDNTKISSLCKLNRNNPKTKNVREIELELEKYRKSNNKKEENSRSLSKENSENNKILNNTNQSIGIEKTSNCQLHEQIEREPNCANNNKEKSFNDIINDVHKHLQNCSKAINNSQNFFKYIYKNSSSAIDELIDNAKNERIDNYFEYIKHDTEYLEKLEAQSIYLINELTK